MATRIKLYTDRLSLKSPNFEDWFEQYEMFYELQDPVPVEGTAAEVVAAYTTRRRAHFISAITGETYSLLKSLLVPQKIEDIDYKQLKKVLIAHCCPKPTVRHERFEFNKMAQKVGESVHDFLARLRMAGAKCDFRDGFEEKVLDQFIFGILNEECKDLLLAEEIGELTLKQAVEKTLIKERSQKEAQTIGYNSEGAVNKVWTKQDQNQKQKWQNSKKMAKNKGCAKCGMSNHKTEDCRTICHKCKRLGHMRRNCPTKNARINQCEYDIVDESDATDHVEEEENLSNWAPPMYYVDIYDDPEHRVDLQCEWESYKSAAPSKSAEQRVDLQLEGDRDMGLSYNCEI